MENTLIMRSNLVDLDFIKKYKSYDKITLICEFCEKEFYRLKKSIRESLINNKVIYCSSKCYSEWKINQRVQVKCAQCMDNINVLPNIFIKSKSKKFFCNQSCAATYNNTIYPKKQKIDGYLKCLQCDNVIRTNQDCCSRLCRKEYNWTQQKAKIENTKGFEKENRRLTRKYLIEKNGHKCAICNISEWTGFQVPLVCDHIDGHSDNNQLSNLRMICQNCNALLPTFGSKNRGNGRLYKRQKYHIDKLTYKD